MSTLRVNNIDNVGGTDLSVNGYPRQPGQIIEYLSSPCDGSVVVGASGSYTFGNVSSSQDFTATYADINGSTIVYTPPEGASRVVYRFDFSYSWRNQTHSIQHYKFFIDGVEVLFSRHNKSATHLEDKSTFEWTIPIGGSANTSTGRQSSWTTAKTLKMQSRRYATSSHGGIMHGTYYWDGTGISSQFCMPTLTIIAIA
jgi:hypothetical protein